MEIIIRKIVVVAIGAAKLGMVDIRADNSRIHSTAMHSRRIGMFKMPKERDLSGFWTFLTMEEARICCGI